jgi:hypothetical protein
LSLANLVNNLTKIQNGLNVYYIVSAVKYSKEMKEIFDDLKLQNIYSNEYFAKFYSLSS